MQPRPLTALVLAFFVAGISAQPAPQGSPDAPQTASDAQGSTDQPSSPTPSAQRLEYGAYLTLAGGCLGCHTSDGGAPFAGGRPFETPFGVVRSSNITPAAAAGIGGFSDQDFLRAMQQGVSPDGAPYYPVCPYPSFTRVEDDALLAVKDYLFSQPAVAEAVAPSILSWPMDVRGRLYGWQEKFFTEARFSPDSGHGEDWNRGAFLVEGLGHCAACHVDDAAVVEPGAGWFLAQPAPALSKLVGDADVDALTTRLAAGLRASRQEGAQDDGPGVADLVHGGIARLAAADHRAIATYLADLPRTSPAVGSAESGVGAKLYARYCSACHKAYGQGEPPYFPPLRDNPNITAEDPSAVIESVLLGAPKEAADAYSRHAVMPSFAAVFDDSQVAQLLSYIRSAWGNGAESVTAEQVGAARAQP